MNVVFRADASAELGSGHLARCLTLADELARHGCTCHFLIRQHNDVTNRLLADCSHAVWSLGLDSHETADVDAQQSIRRMQTLKAGVAWLIVDHYCLDAGWESAIRPYCASLLVIDDLANRPHGCDVLVDPGMGRDAVDYGPWLGVGSELLLGSKYAILRPKFARHHGQAPLWPEVKRVHVFFGGGAAANYLPTCIDVILGLDPTLQVSALGYCNQQSIYRLQQIHGDRLSWSRFESDVVTHYRHCSVAVGSPGAATWERACLGLPSAILATADNQIPILEKLDRLGLCRYLGPARECGSLHTVSALKAFFADDSLRAALRATGLSAVDGQGTERIVARMLAQR